MPNALRLAVLLLVMLMLLGTPARAQADTEATRANVRQTFQSAMALVPARPFAPAEGDPEALQRYVLYPYLQVARLNRQLALLPRQDAAPGLPLDDEIAALLAQQGDRPVTRTLRSNWLQSLAARRDWPRFLDQFSVERDTQVTLRCHWLAARAAKGATDGLVDDLTSTWLTAKNLPDACDPAIAWWRTQGGPGEALKGRRGMPRPRPPFPAVKGLFGKPTVINNVETLANLPLILHHGAEWYAAMGTKGSKGTKVFALSGMVRRTGLVEVPMGTTLRSVVFDAGGGIPNNKKCKAIQIGGPSGGCVPEPQLDLPTDYEALKNFGTIMGSGGLVVLDESTCMVDFAKFFMEFIQSESCGKCIPCREGTKRMLEILKAVCRPRKREEDIDALLRMQGIMYLQKLGETIKATSLCGLGQTAPNPVLSTLKWFRDEYEAHIFERRCPAGSCKELVGAPCQSGCPLGTEVWRYVAHIARGEYQDAYRAIRGANPFPSACARVCHHPCERTCRAGQTGGEPIAIRMLKRFVVDRVDPSVAAPVVVPAAKDAPKVAIIGAGPSGLAAAHYLSLLGNKVTIFEREQKAGGMLVAAIPAYRLPRDTLQKEIDTLLNPNVEVKYGVALGKDVTIDGLMKEGYKAVYLALGAHQSKKLEVPGEDAKGVLPGVPFLKAYNLHGKETAKGRVGIIGGGNSAIDAARVALREKGVTSVTVYYRRTRQEMPAYAEEIEAALHEGVKIEELVAPVAVLSKNGTLTGLKLIRNKLGERDSSGRQKPVPVPGSEFEVELDTLIAAISEEAETAGLDGLRMTKWKTVAINPESYATDRAGVFAGGDMVTGPSTVVGAVAAGKNAAIMIDRYLHGKLMKTLPKVALPVVYVEPVQLPDEDAEPAARVRPPELPVKERAKCFAEVELAVSEQAAHCEARRCLRCDLDFTQPE